jgi:uncharacterized protein YutE (UPF0331/DUF86 family)
MVDEDAVQRRLALLAAYADPLAGLRDLAPGDYASRRFEARYLVQACAQICIDLANHLIASAGWPAARDQRDAFARLAEHGVLDLSLAERLQALAGLRNRLVHLYDDIDDARVQQALGAGLNDLDGFARSVARQLTS